MQLPIRIELLIGVAAVAWSCQAYAEPFDGHSVDWADIWGASPGDVWAVGYRGVLAHWDGANWTPIASGTSADLIRIRGSGADDIWAVGKHGTLLHWDGLLWSVIPLATHANLRGVSGGAGGWIVGDKGTLLNLIDGAWVPYASPTSNDLMDVWSASDTDVWAVGRGGIVMHWDGLAWTIMPVASGVDFNGVYGSASDDVWVTDGQGALHHWDGTNWKTLATCVPEYCSEPGFGRVWTAGGLEAYATVNDPDPGGFTPRFYHYHGTLDDEFSPGYLDRYHSIWGTSSNDFWVAGAPNLLQHWDGVRWTKSAVPSESMSGFVGTSVNNLWVLDDTQVWHWDGGQWTPTDAPPLTNVWFSDEAHGWGVDSDGNIYTSDGTHWTLNTSISALKGSWCCNVSGGSPNDVWVASQVSAHWDGHTWTEFPIGNLQRLSAIYVAGPSEAWALGDTSDWNGTIAHWDGRTWTVELSSLPPSPAIYGSPLTAIAGSGPKDVWAVGFGALAFHWDGTSWTQVTLPAAGNFSDVSIPGPDDGWIVGDGGLILRRQHDVWGVAGPNLLKDLTSVWSDAAGNAIMTGTYGAVLEERNGQWTARRGEKESFWNLGATSVHVYAVQGGGIAEYGSTTRTRLPTSNVPGFWKISVISDDDIWSTDGLSLFHWDGKSWSMPSVELGEVEALWAAGTNDVWVISGVAYPQHYDGKAWTGFQLEDSVDLIQGLYGSDPNDVWAVGVHGVADHWDGTVWTASTTGTTDDLNAVWLSGPGDAWAVGNNGRVLHFQGGAGSVVDAGTWEDLFAVTGTSASDVWVAGELGTVLHFDGHTWAPQSTGTVATLRAARSLSPKEVWVAGDDGVLLRHPVK